MQRLCRLGALTVLAWTMLISVASAQAPAGTYTCTFYGSRYVGTGWTVNGRKFTYTHSDSAVASRTAQKQCQDDYLRDGLDPNSIVNACVYGPCDFKPATPTNPQQIDPKVQQTCNAYADSVVSHYNYFKSNCPSGNYGFQVDRAKYYGDCTAGMLFYKKKFDPQANDYRKQVAANCARMNPLLQPNTQPNKPNPRNKFCHDYADFAKKASQDWGKRLCAGGPPTHDRWNDHQSWCLSQPDATVQQAMATIRAKSASCNAGPAPSSAGARSFSSAANPGLCIEVEKGRAAAGTKIQLWNCTGKGPQKFVMESGPGRIRYAGTNFCVEQAPGGRPLVLTPCNQTFNRWTYDGGSSRIVGAGAAAGKCWDVPGGRFNPLQYVGIWTCHNGPEQKFQLP